MKRGHAVFFLFVIFLAASQWSCNSNVVGTTTPSIAKLSGTVVSSNSGNPVEAATVVLSFGNTRDSVVTGKDGNFSFVIDVPDTATGVDVTLTVHGTGYITYTRTFKVKSDQTFPVSLNINSATYAVLSGTVQDSLTQYPLGGSSMIVSLPSPSSSMIKAMGLSGSRPKSVSSIIIDSTTTLGNGSFVMSVNLYALSTLNAVMTVSKAGFKTYQRNLILRRGTTQNVVVPLQQDLSQSVAHIVGRVTDSRSGYPVTNATVFMNTSLKRDSMKTLNDGSYSFDLNLPGATSSITGTLLFQLDSYNDTTLSFTVGAGKTVSKNVALSPKTSVVGGEGSTGRGVARSFHIVSVSPNEISIHGVGGTETSLLVWQVLDSLGFPLDINHRDTVTFVPTGAPVLSGSPAYVTPTSGITDGSGQVSTTLNSGTVAGTIQLFARLKLGSGEIVESSPVVITVDGGLPDQAHFTFGVNTSSNGRFNFAGYDWFGRTDPVIAQAGDKYGNPVHPGTAIYFTSTWGGIATAAGYTNLNGQATAVLLSGNPLPHISGLDPTRFGSASDPLLPLLDGDYGFPNDPTYFGSGTGYGYVKASSQGENGVGVADSSLFCFSASTAPILLKDSLSIAPVTVKLDSGSVSIPVHISDRFGNPLESGTTISVTVAIPPSLGGLVSNVYSANETGLPETLDDFLTRGFGKTDFILTVSVAQIQGTPTSTQFGVTIKVKGSNGTRETSFSGIAVP
ncbi:MAG: carboxypeptidase regulatory-like domain-containing protein [Bacteroidetes bacterium]|nr:carboxypeptidase regulatory-like domain-containing protein [Bacteroidota bacterium]